MDFKNYLIDYVRKKIMEESNKLNISTKCSKAYMNSKTIQKDLFDLTIFVSKTDVDETYIQLKKRNIKDYYRAIAVTGILSGRLTDLINGKR